MRRTVCAAVTSTTVAVAIVGLAAAGAADITRAEIRDRVFVFEGAGSNVVALADGEDLLVIDGGLEENSDDLFTAIRDATGGTRIGVLINTHWHPEQVGLNGQAGADGATIIAHEQTATALRHPVTSPLFEGAFGPLATAAQPTETGRAGGSLRFAGHAVEYGYLPAAHTDGDLYVFFPDLDVLVAGGAVGSDSWPLIDYWNGAFIGGLVRAHERLAELVDDDTLVIPAQGPAITGAEVA